MYIKAHNIHPHLVHWINKETGFMCFQKVPSVMNDLPGHKVLLMSEFSSVLNNIRGNTLVHLATETDSFS